MSPKTASILTAVGMFALFFAAACLVLPVSEVSIQAGRLTMLAGMLAVAVLTVGLGVLGLGLGLIHAALFVGEGIAQLLELVGVLRERAKQGLHASRTWLHSKQASRPAQLPLF